MLPPPQPAWVSPRRCACADMGQRPSASRLGMESGPRTCISHGCTSPTHALLMTCAVKEPVCKHNERRRTHEVAAVSRPSAGVTAYYGLLSVPYQPACGRSEQQHHCQLHLDTLPEEMVLRGSRPPACGRARMSGVKGCHLLRCGGKRPSQLSGGVWSASQSAYLVLTSSHAGIVWA